MTKSFFLSFTILSCVLLINCGLVSAQSAEKNLSLGLELSEAEGIPVIIKHLPDWESKRNEAVFIRNAAQLRVALGDRALFSVIDFVADTEAVTASYNEGKLLIVEYGTPQASIDTDKKVNEYLLRTPQILPIFYQRIGNYNVFVLDGTSEGAANTLFNKIKYEKVVRWLSYDPFVRRRAERGFIRDTRDLFLATALAIFLGLGIAVAFGVLAGVIFYQFRRRRRVAQNAFSDGGGLTRLNLDKLTSEIAPSNFLND